MEISPVASFDMVLFKKRIPKALIRDCADAQAGLHLCCTHTLEDRFSRDKAHIIQLYCLAEVAVEASFYSDMVQCLHVDPATEV